MVQGWCIVCLSVQQQRLFERINTVELTISDLLSMATGYGPCSEGDLAPAWCQLTADTIGRVSRDAAIALLAWNDPDGCYTDDQRAFEEFEPFTTEGAREKLLDAYYEAGGE